MTSLPEKFLSRMGEIMPENRVEESIASFGRYQHFSIRVNPLKSSLEEAVEALTDHQIRFSRIKVLPDALVMDKSHKQALQQLDLLKEGKIYIQNLSSQLIPGILDVMPDDLVLDMCAAPGSKATQMAAMMGNKGRIIALEKVRGRFHKLKAVIELLGGGNIEVKCFDARAYRPQGLLFDKVLVDAPCSSEGRFDVDDPKSTAYWSERKIKEMKRKQKGLLLRGCQLLRKGGTLVYSTCTFAPEENEEVVNWALRKMQGQLTLVPIDIEDVPTYPSLLQWRKKTYSKETEQCLRIFPDGIWDAFFAAKLKKTS